MDSFWNYAKKLICLNYVQLFLYDIWQSYLTILSTDYSYENYNCPFYMIDIISSQNMAQNQPLKLSSNLALSTIQSSASNYPIYFVTWVRVISSISSPGIRGIFTNSNLVHFS